MNQEEIMRRAEILKVMAHPHRLMILNGLHKSRCKVGDIQKKIGLSQSGLSQHLSKMRDIGIIIGERSGKEICYRISDDFALEILKISFRDC
ncbi:MAG: winged helix-turn-helix transcriptional regulator [Clostridiaceae bacterium]|nr:winged helix-turn-helix transcriptional regulator [Clostridiaceae bacterium]